MAKYNFHVKKAVPDVCFIEAPCKINLHLEIGEKRPDAYHNLKSLFVSLALGDTLRFEKTGKEGDCSLEMNWDFLSPDFIPAESIPLEKNLIFRAVSLFREKTGCNSGLLIRVDKRIPAGAGLGGGSSDAASCLLALNCLFGLKLPVLELKKMAALLGSDVPFFLEPGGAAFVSGRGEIVEPVKAPEGLWVILLKPPFASGTAEAFRLLDEARGLNNEKAINTNNKKNLSKKTLIQALGKDPVTWPFYNDFLNDFLSVGLPNERTEAYRALLSALRETGASFAGLSGSGSCCFGVFKAKDEAKKAEKKLIGQGNFVRLTFFLAQNAKPVVKC